MKDIKTKIHHYNALTTAAVMITTQFETGSTYEEAGFDSEEDMQAYIKECKKVAKTLESKAKSYAIRNNLFNQKEQIL